MENCTIEDFSKLALKIGTIKQAEPVTGSEKLLKLSVDFGDETRQILSGIAQKFEPEALVGLQATFIVNLEPRTMMGLESQGMILATHNGDDIVVIQPSQEVPAGSKIG